MPASTSKSHRFWPVMVQYIVSGFFFLFLYALIAALCRFLFRYQIQNRAGIRQQFLSACEQVPSGLLICANHLSFVDSILIIYALGSPWTYLRHYKRFAWNLPKRSHVKSSRFFQAICYLGKCLLFPDDTPNDIKYAMEKLLHLLKTGHYVMLFPEGTRSRTGRLNRDDFGYGAGQLVNESSIKQVLCLYIRPDRQEKAMRFPPKRSKITLALKLIEPTSEANRSKARARDLSREIMATLASMEDEYFQTRESDDAHR